VQGLGGLSGIGGLLGGAGSLLGGGANWLSGLFGADSGGYDYDGMDALVNSFNFN
jgi:hypothetical protein